MLVEKIMSYKKKQLQMWPVRSNRASSLGHPCERYLVLERTRWQDKTPPDAGLQLIFDLGNMIEKQVLRDLDDCDITVIEQQRSFEWKEFQITGHIDGKVVWGDKIIPLEIKSMSPFMFDKVNSVWDMQNSKYSYMRKYPAQMQLYLFMDEKELGLFLLKNKSTGQYKEILVDIDYDAGELLLQKATRINKHVEKDTLPDCIPWDDYTCQKCDLIHVCCPVKDVDSADVYDDEELAGWLTEVERLHAYHLQYNAADKMAKKYLEGKKFVCGDFFCSGEWVDHAVYNIPEKIKQKYKKNNPYWKRKVTRL